MAFRNQFSCALLSTTSLAILSTLALFPSAAYASGSVDWSSFTTNQGDVVATPSGGNNLTLTQDGNIATVGGTAVVNSSTANTQINVNDFVPATEGISSTGNNATISITGSGVLNHLTLTSGTIKGQGTTNSNATVYFNPSADSDTTFSTDIDGTISNSGAGGTALYIGNGGAWTGSVTNTGHITTADNANSYGIYVDSHAGTDGSIVNNGTINAGTLGTAIYLGAADTTAITNNGTIIGAVKMNNSGQLLYMSAGQVNGTIDGGNLELDNHTGYGTNGAIGSNTVVNNITVDNGSALGALNSIHATTITINAGGEIATGSSSITATSTTLGGVDGLLDLDSAGTYSGTIDGAGANQGELRVTGTHTTNATIGGTNALNKITVLNSSSFTLAHNAAAQTVNLRNGATLNINNGVLLDDHGSATAVTLGSGGFGGGNVTLKVGTTAVHGTIDGFQDNKGILEISGTQTSNGVIGGTHPLSLLQVDNGATFTDANVTKASAFAITGASTWLVGAATTFTGGGDVYDTSLLKINSGGSVVGDTYGFGTGNVEINTGTNYAAQGAFGATSGLDLSTITVDSGSGLDLATNNKGAAANSIVLSGTATLKVGNSNVVANTTTIGSGGKLQISGSGTYSGTIDGAASGEGQLEISHDFTSGGNIGTATANLNNITVDNGASFTLANNASANTTTISNGYLIVGNGNTLTSNVTITNSGGLRVGTATVVGTIDGDSSTPHGLLEFTGSSTPTADIGSGHPLQIIYIDNNATLSSAHNITANFIDLGSGASGTLTQTAGTITSYLQLNAGTIYNYNGGSFSGAIEGLGSSTGTVNINHNYTSTQNIAPSNGIAALNVANGDTLTLGGNVRAVNTNVHGVLDTGAAGRTVTGNVTIDSDGEVNIRGNTTTVTGTLTTAAGSQLNVTAGATSGSVGKMTVGGSVSIVNGTILNLNLTQIPTQTTDYTIITGSGANNGALSLPSHGLYSVSDVSTAGNRIIEVSHATSQTLGVNTSQADTLIALYNAANSTGTLNSFVNSAVASTTSSQANSLLNQTTPTVMAVKTQKILGLISAVTAEASEQMSGVGPFGGSDHGTKISGSSSLDTGLAAGDDTSTKGAWMQAFGTEANQSTRDGVSGYSAGTGGVAIGLDKAPELLNGGHAGVSFSYANSSVSSNDALQKTNVTSYQTNLYAVQKYDNNWYSDALVGVSYNQYNTTRNIASVGVMASGDFSGEGYTARLGGGRDIALRHNVLLTPSATLSYSYSTFQNYTETGADTLNLHVKSSNSQQLESKIGSGIGYSFTARDGTSVRPGLHAAWMYDMIADAGSGTATFTGGGAPFSTKGLRLERNGFNLGADLNMVSVGGVDMLANYDLEKRSTYTSHSGSLRLRYSF